MRCHSVRFSTVNQQTQSTARNCGAAHDAMIRFYDEAGNMIETHEHTGDFKEP